jgi:DNA-binding transcriptional MerR regulator
MSLPEGDRRRLHIGELSRRVGVKPEVLRAWERRYGLFSPARTTGGFRLYDEADEQRVQRMLELLGQGVSTAEAARLARAGPPGPREPAQATGAPPSAALGELLRGALDKFDDAGAHAALDRLLGSFPLESAIRDVVLPYLYELGERWERGEVSVAQEHFASVLLRGRLLALARGWGVGGGPRALLACLPGDQHDLGLICFGLALRGHGWRITYLGPDTPLSTLTQTADVVQPALVVVTATLPEHAEDAVGGLRELACVARLAVAGRGASSRIADLVGARYLDGDPVSAAGAVASAGTDEF